MSHVDFKKWHCRMSLSLNCFPQCHMHVDFKEGYVQCQYTFYTMSHVAMS